MSDVEFTSTTFERDGEEVTEHYWSVRDDNNEKVSQGEGYDSAAGARRGFLNATQAMVDAAFKLAAEVNLILDVSEVKQQHREEGVDVSGSGPKAELSD